VAFKTFLRALWGILKGRPKMGSFYANDFAGLQTAFFGEKWA
jgi:hypothetical protein